MNIIGAFRSARVRGRVASFGRILLLLLIIGTSAALTLELGAWTQEEIYQGPFATEGGANSRSLVLAVGRHQPFGCCFEVRGDDNKHPSRSVLKLWINKEEMGPPHSMHETIRRGGTTAFSHWGSHVIFSLPPNAENSEATHVRVRYAWQPPAGSAYLLALTTAFVGLLLYRRAFRASLKRAYKLLANLIGALSRTRSRLATQRAEPFFSRRQLAPAFLAIAVFAAGVAFTVAVHRAQMVIVDIEGSKPAPTFPSFMLYFTVGGANPQNFVTADPPGIAFLSWRYDRPVTLTHIAHTVVGRVDRSTAMRAMSLQYREESGGWTEALRAHWSELDPNGWHAFAIPEPHSRAASANWRVVALEGGAGGELVVGWLSPMPSPASALTFLMNKLELDVLLLLSCCIAAVVLAAFNLHKAGLVLFAGWCLAIVFVINVIVFGLVRPPLLWAPDTASYLVWPPTPVRPPGMTLIDVSLFSLLGFSGLHVFQVNMVLLSYLGALACLASATRRYWPFIPLTILPIVWGNFVVHASWILSEAWFMAAMLIALSGLIALVLGAGRITAVWAASGLLLAVCAKAVGVVLLIPAVLAYRFIPGPRLVRRHLVVLTIGPAILGYLAMCVYGYTASGRFSPHTVGGHSLIGHVAWMLEPADLPEQHREVGRKAVAELRDLYAAMPPMTEPERYVDFTTNMYNVGYAVLKDHFPVSVDASTPSEEADRRLRRLYATRNDLFTAWARDAIARDPLRYAAHCALHFLGLWRDSLANYHTVGQSRWPLLREGYHQGRPEVQLVLQRGSLAYYSAVDFLPAFIEYNDTWRRTNEPHLLAAREYRLLSVTRSGSLGYITSGLLLAALVISALYIVPARYPPVVAGMIIWALFVNAYFGGHALFQVTLLRYGELIVPLLPLLAGLILASGWWPKDNRADSMKKVN